MATPPQFDPRACQRLVQTVRLKVQSEAQLKLEMALRSVCRQSRTPQGQSQAKDKRPKRRFEIVAS
jgi:hypothetical protein